MSGVMERIATAFERIAVAVEKLVPANKPPSKPGLMTINFKGETTRAEGVPANMADKISFSITVPEAPESDVVRRELKVTLADGTVLEDTIDGRLVGESSDFVGDQDSTITCELVEFDDGENKSPARTQTFVLKDTVAPGQPGEMGINIKGEQTQ